MIWLVLTLMTAAALALLLVPLLRRRGTGAARLDYDVAVYRRQLAELEAELAAGAVPAAEAAAARAEVERRILAAASHPEIASSAARSWARPVAVGLALALPLAALALYFRLGSPDIPGAPWGEGRPAMASAETAELPEVAAKLAKRMRQNPDDSRGWRLLGRSYLTLGRHGEAARAFARAVALDDTDIAAWVGLGEALTFGAQGTVTPEARTAFKTALARDRDDPRARYYLGLAARQAGRPQDAYDRWLALVRGAEPAAPWLDHVLEQLAGLAGELGIDLAAELPPALRQRPAKAGPRGSDADDVEAAAEMSGEERGAFIRSMVARLAKRLEEAPDDVEGWMRLAKAYSVLGRHEKAAKAYAKAEALAPDDATPRLLRARVLIEAADPAGPLPPAAIGAYRAVLELDPEHGEALWFTGLADAQAGRPEAAIAAWERLLPQLSPESAERKMLTEELAKARARLQ